MKTIPLQLAAALLLATTAYGYGQQVPFDRLPPEVFDVTPPSDRVSGEPGGMRVLGASCRTLPTAETRRRIVDVAVQEWGFFGFPIDDQAAERDDEGSRGRSFRRRYRGDGSEAARVASSIGGYWAATSDGSWIVQRQNDSWNGSSTMSTRWRDPWSAAFISWVMCEGGLGETSQFQRAIAHHTYIDQAIRARDLNGSEAAFVAYDSGEVRVEPGDLLCSARRPAYQSVAERRRQIGVGARTHCDIVVKVDEPGERILAIGGNVGGRVSLKILPATRNGAILGPTSRGGRPMFAHLKLRADAIDFDALDSSPTMEAMAARGCSAGGRTPNQVTAMNLISTGRAAGYC
jgi:hypothetical protein